MVDTIQIMVPPLNYKILSYCPIEVVGGNKDLEGKEDLSGQTILFEVDNKSYIGKKAYINNEYFNLTIKPITFKTAPLSIIQTSVPKLLFSSNVEEIKTQKELKEAVFGVLNEKLKEAGFITDLTRARLKRVDIVKNCLTEYPFHFYTNILRALKMRGNNKRGYEYPTSFLKGNSNLELCLYDKVEEQRQKNIIKEEYLGKNILRAELRLLKHRKVRKSLNIITLEELLENYEGLGKYYKGFLEKSLFHIKEVQALENNTIKELEYYAYNGGKYWVNNFLIHNGLKALKPYERIILEWVGKYKGKSSKSRLKSRFLEVFEVETSGVPFEVLYNELREKLLA